MVDWSRYRAMGIDLLLVGMLVLVISSGFALVSVCPSPGVCYIDVDWAALSPAIALIAGGAFLSVMARRAKLRSL